MINWNTDEKAFKKLHPKEYKLWRIIQLINYGLDGEKLDEKELKRVWRDIKDRLSPDKRKVLEFLLWNKKWRREPGLAFDRSNFWEWFFGSRTSSKTST